MRIEQLIYFVETAKQEHIGKASKILGISPSAISHSIKSLESELGMKLFQKKSKFIILTEEGRKLLEKSQDLIAEFQNLKHSLLSEHSDQSYYKIGASHTIASKFVTPSWSKLSNKYASSKIDLLTLRSAEVLEGVLSQKLDIGVLFSPQEHPEIEFQKIYEGQLYLTVGKNHPILKKRVNERIKEISKYPSVLPKAFQGIDVCIKHPIFKRFSITPNAVTLTDSYDISLELIAKNHYWGLTPDLLINLNSNLVKAVKPKDDWDAKFNISIIWRKKRTIPVFFKDLADDLRNTIN